MILKRCKHSQMATLQIKMKFLILYQVGIQKFDLLHLCMYYKLICIIPKHVFLYILLFRACSCVQIQYLCNDEFFLHLKHMYYNQMCSYIFKSNIKFNLQLSFSKNIAESYWGMYQYHHCYMQRRNWKCCSSSVVDAGRQLEAIDDVSGS